MFKAMPQTDPLLSAVRASGLALASESRLLMHTTLTTV